MTRLTVPGANGALRRILEAPQLARSVQLRKLLEYLVLETLAGRHEKLKEYTIGVEVFERGEDFDPRIDPIVRVQTSKLRQRLASYYADGGAGEALRFEIERGSYVPLFLSPEQRLEAGPALEPLSHLTVAVMPLLNVTGDPRKDYLCAGLAEELISFLGQVPGLRVIARTSSFALAARKLDVREIGAALDAAYLVEGSLRTNSQGLLATFRLIDARTGMQLWNRRFRGALQVFPDFEHWIGHAVAESILNAAQGAPGRPLVQPIVAEGFDLTLRAWHESRSGSSSSFLEALRLFERAIEVDPGGYRQLAGYSTLCAIMANFGLMAPDEAATRARPAMQRAIEAAPEASEPWESKGTFESLLEWKHHQAAESYEKALEINPSNLVAQHGLAVNCYMALGDMDRAVSGMRRACALDPLSQFAAGDLTYALVYSERYDEAIEQSLRAAELDPTSDRGRYDPAFTLLCAGRPDEALEILERDPPQPHMVYPNGFVAWALAALGRREDAEAQLENLRQNCPGGKFATEIAALVLLELGLRDEALSVLEDLVARRDPQMRYLAVEPSLQELRGEPRFEALLAQVGLP